MLSKEQFKEQPQEEMVKLMLEWKKSHTVTDIYKAMGYNNATPFYNMLRSVGIYDQVVRRIDKPLTFGKSGDQSNPGTPKPPAEKDADKRPPIEQKESFTFDLKTTLSGKEIADKLERISYFLQGEMKLYTIDLSLTPYENEKK